eukprot:TRINITY_DN18322_c0_g1_i1.p1 TRINITY_DN18322_c0_g1~~TRINITY_DN18322_c0_g1_i1.p1  ORF type:complete len:174 (-),score=40.65 TRINITY_DN18322_c0_g1_i1:206-727(-)
MAAPLDFRHLDEGVGHQKRRKRKAEEWEEEQQAAKRVPVPMEEDTGAVAAVAEEKSYTGTLGGRASGRKWRAAASERTSSLKRNGTAVLKTTWEKKMQLKAQAKAFKERKEVLKETIRSSKQAKRAQVAERKKRKEENELKSLVVQKITNPKTIKKMKASKKQRKLLRTAAGT